MNKKNSTNKDVVFKMKDLVEKTGFNKETIHFYLTEGLLPEPKKTSKNMSWYSKEHISRLNKIRELQEKQFLPLKVIKAILNNSSDYEFTEEQHTLIEDVKSKMFDSSQSIKISIKEILEKKKIDKKELEDMNYAKFIITDTETDTLTLEDYNLVENWIKLREMGVTKLGFNPKDLEIFIDIVEIIFGQELLLIRNKSVGLSYQETENLIEKAIPIVNNIISILHQRKLREFITFFSSNGKY